MLISIQVNKKYKVNKNTHPKQIEASSETLRPDSVADQVGKIAVNDTIENTFDDTQTESSDIFVQKIQEMEIENLIMSALKILDAKAHEDVDLMENIDRILRQLRDIQADLESASYSSNGQEQIDRNPTLMRDIDDFVYMASKAVSVELPDSIKSAALMFPHQLLDKTKYLSEHAGSDDNNNNFIANLDALAQDFQQAFNKNPDIQGIVIIIRSLREVAYGGGTYDEVQTIARQLTNELEATINMLDSLSRVRTRPAKNALDILDKQQYA